MPFDVIVVGAGIVGAASTYCLTKHNFRVALLDQGGIPNPQAPSVDHASVFRLTFGKDSFYTDLALKSMVLWKQFQQEVHEALLLQTGMLDLATSHGGYEEQCFEVLKQMSISVQKLQPAEISKQYQTIRSRSCRFAVFHPDGGMVWSQRAVASFAKAAQKKGAQIQSGVKIVRVIKDRNEIQGLKDAQGKVWKAAQYLFAAGPWTREILSSYGLPLKVTRQESLYIRPPRNQGRYRPAHFPIFSLMSRGFHGFPIHIHGFMKLSSHRKGPVCREINVQDSFDKKFEGKCRSFFKEFFPDLVGFSEVEGRISYYTWTPDGDFLLDRLPGSANAWIAAGFSGLGPIFAPLVGMTLAQLMSKAKPDINLHRFRLERLRRV